MNDEAKLVIDEMHYAEGEGRIDWAAALKALKGEKGMSDSDPKDEDFLAVKAVYTAAERDIAARLGQLVREVRRDGVARGIGAMARQVNASVADIDVAHKEVEAKRQGYRVFLVQNQHSIGYVFYDRESAELMAKAIGHPKIEEYFMERLA